MKRLTSLWRDYLEGRTLMRTLIKPWNKGQYFKYIVSTLGLAFLATLLPALLIINLLMFVTYIKVFIVYGALLGYFWIWLSHILQIDYLKDYSNPTEFDKIRRLFKLHSYMYGLLWFALVYGLYLSFGGYIV